MWYFYVDVKVRGITIKNRHIVVALDVGTHTVKAAMAEVVAVNSINVLGISAIPARE